MAKSIGLRGFAVLLATLALSPPSAFTIALGATRDPEQTAEEMMTAAAKQSINRALEYLASRQNEDGSFGLSGYSRNVAVCGLAGMAFMSGGSTPGRGTHGVNVDRCIDYLLSHVHESGFINYAPASSHGPMYGHGFASLFLAEVYGMSPRGDLREKLSKAVQLIIDTQNDTGGWRYQPERRDADISVTICQVMALRAARNAGIYVPNDTIDRCVDYVKRSQNPDGGFMYTLDGGPSEFPRSAAGVVALYSAGIYEGEELEKGLAYLSRFVPADDLRTSESHFFYAHYYAVQAYWQSGGEQWLRWFPAIRDKLVSRQSADGSWINSICPEYGTAMAAIILQMPNNCLPIFQR